MLLWGLFGWWYGRLVGGVLGIFILEEGILGILIFLVGCGWDGVGGGVFSCLKVVVGNCGLWLFSMVRMLLVVYWLCFLVFLMSLF